MNKSINNSDEIVHSEPAKPGSLKRSVGQSDLRRWKKRLHGKYSRNGDLLTVRTAEALIEELQDTIAALSNERS